MKQILFFLSFIALVASCSPDRDKLSEKITQLEAAATAPKEKLDEAVGEELFEQYDQFLENFPQDSIVPQLLYKGGQIAILYRQNLRASEYLTRLIKDFPDNEITPHAYMVLGNFYANKIHDLDRAKAIYDDFIAKYPDNKMVAQVQFMLETLGMTPDEMLQYVQANNR